MLKPALRPVLGSGIGLVGCMVRGPLMLKPAQRPVLRPALGTDTTDTLTADTTAVDTTRGPPMLKPALRPAPGGGGTVGMGTADTTDTLTAMAIEADTDSYKHYARTPFKGYWYGKQAFINLAAYHRTQMSSK